MRKLFGAVLAVAVGCGGAQQQPPSRAEPYFDPSGTAFSADEALAGIGKFCVTGRDCASGLACTNYVTFRVTQCELPGADLGPGLGCPLGLVAYIPSTLVKREPFYFCLHGCNAAADCRNAQCCMSNALGAQSCVYDDPVRWPGRQLQCGG